jgi:hypothetical protein
MTSDPLFVEDISVRWISLFEDLLKCDSTDSLFHIHLEKNIKYQIMEWSNFTNEIVLNYLLIHHHLLDHIGVLKSTLLMQAGRFIDLLFHRLEAINNVTFHVSHLNIALQEAIYTGLIGMPSEYTDRISFIPLNGQDSRRRNPVANHGFTTTPTTRALDCVRLNYRIDWPLNIILTRSIMEKYYDLFTHFSLFRRLLYSLTVVSSGSLQSSHHHKAHEIHLALFRIRHFIQSMLAYLNDVAVHMSWIEFVDHLNSRVKHLDDLYHYHHVYLDLVCVRSFLYRKTETFISQIYAILQIIQQFIDTLPSPQALNLFNTFHNRLLIFIRTIRSLCLKGSQVHLQHLLLRLTLNDYNSPSPGDDESG